MRCVIPPVFIRLPARMKNGIASSGNDVVAEYIRCAIITSMSGPPIESMMSVPVSAIAMAIGRPTSISATSVAKTATIVMARQRGGG